MKQGLIHLLRELWQPRFRGSMMLAGLLLFLAKIMNILVPLLYKHVVDSLTLPKESLALMLPLLLIAAYGGVRISAMLLAEFQQVVFNTVMFRVMREVAVRMFRHMHNLSLRFHLEKRSGGLSRIIERGVDSILEALEMVTWVFAPASLELLMTLGIILWMFGPLMAAVIVTSIVIYVVFTLKVTARRMDIRREANEQNTKANAQAIDSLLNYETVKYFGNEEREAQRYDEIQSCYEVASIRSRTSLALLNGGQTIIISLGLVSVMALAARDIIHGQRSLGDFVMVVAYMAQLYQPLNFLGSAYRAFTQALIDMEKMFELLAVNQEVADKPEAIPLQPGPGLIEFNDVSFSYDARRPILQQVSFKAEPGQMVAIVGPSGAGKSTLSRLLFRFYDIDSGSIRIDGQDIRDITQHSLRAAIGIVPQDTVLFNNTIGYNIAYGRPDALPEEIREAARMAQIDDFCRSLPDGYETMVGERGLKLSGGEKQRVAIARTILKNPRLLIFDEATSALDTHTEKEIQASLRSVSQGRTTLTIAHRLSTIADADLILVLENGQIVERGRHSELVQQNGLYAALWRRQQEAEERAFVQA